MITEKHGEKKIHICEYIHVCPYIHVQIHVHIILIHLEYSQVQQQVEMEAQKRVSTENLSLDDRVEEATSNDVSRRRGLTGLPIVVRGRLTRDKDNHYRQIRIPVARNVGQGEDSSSHKIFEKIPKRSEATMQTWAHIWVFVRLLQRPSNVLLFLQGIPGCMPWGVIGVFLNDYFVTDRNAPSKIGDMSLFLSRAHTRTFALHICVNVYIHIYIYCRVHFVADKHH